MSNSISSLGRFGRQPFLRRINRRQRGAAAALAASGLSLASGAGGQQILGEEGRGKHERETEDRNQALHTCPFNRLEELGSDAR